MAPAARVQRPLAEHSARVGLTKGWVGSCLSSHTLLPPRHCPEGSNPLHRQERSTGYPKTPRPRPARGLRGGPGSGTLGASCSPCPRAHPGLRLLPGSGGARGQEGRHAGAQPRHGLGGNARGRLGRRAGRLKVTAGRSGDARPALTIRAASGGWNGTAFAPPTPGPQTEDGAGTRRRERARIQSERYMVRQETGQDSKRWKPRLRARCQNSSSPLDCTLIQSTASY